MFILHCILLFLCETDLQVFQSISLYSAYMPRIVQKENKFNPINAMQANRS